MTLKVALIQKSAAPNDPAKNMELGISYLEKAKELGADLALFPEMWSTGYAEPFFDALNYPDNRHYVYERQKWSELALTPFRFLCSGLLQYCKKTFHRCGAYRTLLRQKSTPQHCFAH